jgi:thioredoxin-like negative regulator of GroEL
LYRTGEYSKALIELKKAFSLYEDPEIMSHIIEVLVTTNKTSEASALMDEAKNKYPDNLYINELYNRYPLIWE